MTDLWEAKLERQDCEEWRYFLWCDGQYKFIKYDRAWFGRMIMIIDADVAANATTESLIGAHLPFHNYRIIVVTSPMEIQSIRSEFQEVCVCSSVCVICFYCTSGYTQYVSSSLCKLWPRLVKKNKLF